ncbi:MAG: pre-peptidase C-terminal domain-containing protein [Burkholderiales bacterium]|nr:pre-peptidase C-terminal domain-containing protein [Burkholderiales bacterium]
MSVVTERESNNSSSVANAISLGDTGTGSLSSSADQDVFKLVLTEPTVVRITLAAGSYSNFSFGISAYTFINSVNTQLGLNYLGGIYGGDYTIALGAGTTYLDVFSPANYSGDAYTLTVQRGTGAVANYESRPNDSLGQATSLAAGQQMTGQIDVREDVDYYAVDVAAAGRLAVNFTAPSQRDADSFLLSLLDNTGRVIDQVSTASNTSLFEASVAAGRYYVKVASGASREYGNYTVSAQTYADVATATLSAGAGVTDSVSAGAPIKIYTVNLVGGKAYDFSLAQATGGGSLRGATLSLLASNGQSLESTSITAFSSGTSSGTTDPHIAFIAPASGRYVVAVNGLGATGSFTLSETASTVDELLLADKYSANTARARDQWKVQTDTPLTLTFGFLTQKGSPSGDSYTSFAAFSDTQKQAVRDILAGISTIINVRFTETTDMAAANLRYGITDLAGAGSGISYFNRTSEGYFRQNDIYIDNAPQSGTAATASVFAGGRGYATVIHETGHALGLKHPGNYDVFSGTAVSPYLPVAWDQGLFSLMSYNSFTMGSTYHSGFAPLDIAALQSMYGGAANAGAINFSVSTSIPVVITAPVGKTGDTIDASSQTTASVISLVPGTLSSIGVFDTAGGPAHDNVTIPFASQYTVARGGSGNDLLFANALGNSLSGNGGNDVFYSGAGADTMDGGTGQDTVVYSGNRADYTISRSGPGFTVADRTAGRNGSDVLSGVERLEFADGRVALDIEGAPLAAAQIIGAVLGRQYVTVKPAVTVLMDLAAAGLSYEQVAGAIAGSGLFAIFAGSHSNRDFVRYVFTNVVGTAPSAGTLDALAGLLDGGAFSQAGFAWAVAQLPLNNINIDLVGLQQHGLDYL